MEARNFAPLFVLTVCCFFLIGCDRGLTANNLTTQPAGNSSSNPAPPNGATNPSNPTVPSNPAPSVQPSRFLYVATDKMTTFPCCGSSHESILQAFKIDPQTGAIANVGSIQTDPSQRGMVRSPSDLSFYAAGDHSEEAIGYSVDPTSGMPQIITTAHPFHSGIASAITPDGKFVFVFTAGIDSFSADMGRLNAVAQFPPSGMPVTAEGRFASGFVAPNGKFLFAIAGEGTFGNYFNRIFTFSINGDGSFSKSSTIDVGQTGLQAMDASGNYIYGFENASTALHIYQINQKSGALTEASNSPQVLAIPSAGSIVVSPKNTLYVASRSVLAAYSINTSSGALTLIGTAPSPSSYVDMSMDRSGRFIYVATYNPSSIFAFSIDEKGVPHPVQGSPFPIILDSGASVTALLAD